MSLSVIVPSRNIDNLRPCVAAVRKHEPDVRIIVVDDGLDEHEVHMWLKHHMPIDAQFQIIDGVKPFIFARNCNLGIREAGEDDVILLNDDALLESPGGFTLMKRAAQERPYGIIGAVTNLTGQPLQMQRNYESSVRAVVDTAIARIPAPLTAADYGVVHYPSPSDGLREVPHIAFVCVLIPRRTIRGLSYLCEDAPQRAWFTDGLLDEHYCLDYGCEDRDYCEQVHAAGLKVGVHDGCYVDHGSLVSTYRGSPTGQRDYSQNAALFEKKWGKRI